MTFHFAHMAPPGAKARLTLSLVWLRAARTGRPTLSWLTLTWQARHLLALMRAPDSARAQCSTPFADQFEPRAG